MVFGPAEAIFDCSAGDGTLSRKRRELPFSRPFGRRAHPEIAELGYVLQGEAGMTVKSPADLLPMKKTNPVVQ
jgi:hypothetical protein